MRLALLKLTTTSVLQNYPYKSDIKNAMSQVKTAARHTPYLILENSAGADAAVVSITRHQ